MIHLVIEKFVSKIWLTEYGTRALGCREIVDTFSCITDLSRTTKVEYNDSNIVIELVMEAMKMYILYPTI